MKPPDVALRGLVLQWLDKAAADFDAAEHVRGQTASGKSSLFTASRRLISEGLPGSAPDRVSEDARHREVAGPGGRGEREHGRVASERGRAHTFRSGGAVPQRSAGTSSRRRNRGDRHGPPGERCRDDLATAVLRRRLELSRDRPYPRGWPDSTMNIWAPVSA